MKNAGAAGITATAVSTLPKAALSQGVKQLVMVTTWPKNSPGLGTSATRLAHRIGTLSGGKLTVKVYAAKELVPTFQSFDAVSSGTADMYHSVENYWQSKSKAFNFFASVPFGMTATEQNAWIHHGGGQELWDEVSGRFGLKPFMAGNTGVQMGGWFNKEVNTPEDFNGLKMRIPGLGGEVLRRLRGFPLLIPGDEIFPAMHAGAIEATTWFGPWNDLAFGLHKIAKQYYYPGFQEPGTTLSASINIRTWAALSSEHKAIVSAAMAAENDFTLAEYNAKNSEALATLINKHKVEVRRFGTEILNSLGQASGDAVAELGAHDKLTGKVYKSFMKFRKQSIGWSRIADQSYMNARSQPFKYG